MTYTEAFITGRSNMGDRRNIVTWGSAIDVHQFNGIAVILRQSYVYL